jgi:hypothetical protein
MKNLILAILIFTAGLANADTIYSPSISEKTFKIIPTYGVMSLITDCKNINSKINTGVAVEKMLSSRFSLGVLFNYASFKFNDSNTYGLNILPYNNYGYNYNYGYNDYGLNGYYNYYGQSIKSEVFSLGLNTKFFVIDNGILRPLLGGALTYNRNNLNYDYNNSNYNYYNGYNGQYSTSLNSFSGLLMAGTELRFTRDFGLNFDFKYIRTLSNNSDYSYSSFSNLENLGRAMENSDLMSFNLGLLLAI